MSKMIITHTFIRCACCKTMTVRYKGDACGNCQAACTWRSCKY